MKTQHFFIGVDGGATKCVVRMEDEAGNLLGQESSGPANIRISVEQAWQSIHSALNTILTSHAMTLDKTKYHFHTGMGLAGCEVTEAYHAFLNHLTHQDVFNTLVVTSDAHTACLGAHGGREGAIIIAGTGVVGYQICDSKTSKVSGWGFPHDDEGGGAWLGLQAVKLTLQWLDGREPASNLAKTVYAHFRQDRDYLVAWANHANSTAFAELAPLVIQQSEQGNVAAKNILQQAAQAIDCVGTALVAAQPNQQSVLPCVLIGGIAPFLQPLLTPALRSRLRPSLATPDVGAALLVREHIAKCKERS